MAYLAKPSTTKPDVVDVEIPPTRADVLHQCDIMEDVAIAYGFNNLPRSFPSKSGTIAQPLPVNKLTDIIRVETAMAGWSEVLPLILCSHDENFAWLNRKDDGNTAVKLANPKTQEFQVVRTSLLPGLLKTIRENKAHSVPMKIFEVSDVAFKDLSLERKSRNERHYAAAFYGKSSGFEIVHGLMDRVMAMLKSAFITAEEGLTNPAASESQYYIKELNGMYIRNTLIPSFEDSNQEFPRPHLLPRSRRLHSPPHRRQGPGHRQLRCFAPRGPREVRAQVSRQHPGAQHRALPVEGCLSTYIPPPVPCDADRR
jgi:hypothetical protein